MIEYDAHHWRDHLFDLKGSMVQQIIYRVMSCATWSTAVVCIHKYLQTNLEVSSLAHTLIGFSLSLLLVFRTNASYDRFWEGRRLWGSIINETRNLARSVTVLLETNQELARTIVNWTIAFPYAAMNHLRGDKGLGPIAIELPADEARAAQSANHPPLAVARMITTRLNEAKSQGLISDIVFTSIDQNVHLLMGYMGGCERIHRTPLPFAYMVHLRRALIIYCFTLPFVMLKDFGWVTIPGVFLIAYMMFGIEEIGVQIEDPFGADDNDLPLESMCMTIEKNLRALLHEPTAIASAAIEPRSAVVESR
jgi:putative membrane protein